MGWPNLFPNFNLCKSITCQRKSYSKKEAEREDRGEEERSSKDNKDTRRQLIYRYVEYQTNETIRQIIHFLIK